MTSSVSPTTVPTNVRFDADSMWVDLSDGRTLRLLRATPEQREQLRISTRGLYWEALDEDISIAALLAGQPDQTTDKTFAA